MLQPAVGAQYKTKGKTVTYFLIDGLDNEVFKSMIEEGKLPFLQKLITNGLYVKEGISSFPTMTGYGYYPFITGMDATNSGILGLRWFDRDRIEGNLRNYVGRTNPWMNKDIKQEYKTIFELVDTTDYTSSINCFMNRGVKESVITGWDHSAAKFEGKSVFKHIRKIPFVGKKWAKTHFEHEQNVLKIAMEQLQYNPKVQFITFPSPDATVHVEGHTHIYEDLLIYIDQLLAVYWDEVIRLGQADDRMLAIVSDHGVETVKNNIDFKPSFDTLGLTLERGNAVNVMTTQLKEPISSLNKLDAYFVINGNLSAYLYFKDKVNDWAKSTSFDRITNYQLPNGEIINMLTYLSKCEEVEMVVTRKDDSTLWLQTSEGYATIIKKTEKLLYQANTFDVLHIGKLCQISDSISLTENEWLTATYDCDYPYAVPRLWNLFAQKGMGDLLLTSIKGYDFGKDYEKVVGNYRGGHGGLRRSMMAVPFVLYGKGITSETIEYARSEDIGATILKQLGIKSSYVLDGSSLVE